MKFARILQNKTYATVHAEPMIDREGADILSVIAKLALAFDRSGQLGLSARTIRMHDEPDGTGGIRLPSDLAAEKTGTDIGLVGSLIPPENIETNQTFAWLRVGPIGKALQLSGPRVFMSGLQGIAPGPAMQLTRAPLTHALAYGGVDPDANGAGGPAADGGPRPLRFEPYNPTGRGYAEQPARLIGQPAPQIEPAPLPGVREAVDLRSTIARAQAAFSPIPPQWEPRRSLTGTRNAEWRRTRAPVVPADFDARSESWAPYGLWSESPLTGDEPVELFGFRPGPPIRFLLPGFAPAFHSIQNGESSDHPTHLDSVLFDFDEGIVELVWRASIPLPLKWARLERATILQKIPLAPEIVNRPLTRGMTS